jgi:hypothetical protein
MWYIVIIEGVIREEVTDKVITDFVDSPAVDVELLPTYRSPGIMEPYRIVKVQIGDADTIVDFTEVKDNHTSRHVENVDRQIWDGAQHVMEKLATIVTN